MAAQILQNHDKNQSTKTSEIRSEEDEPAIAKAVELRSIHDALRLPSSSSVPHHVSHFSANDYPVFTPSYEEEPLPAHRQIQLHSRTLSRCGYGIGEGNGIGNSSPRNVFHSEVEDHKSITGSCSNNISLSRTDLFKSSRSRSLGDFNSQQKNQVLNLSWFFSRKKKKHKNENLPNRRKSEEIRRVYDDSRRISVEALKKELIEANQSRDEALMEVAEMKSSVEELKQKLEYLETYCEELKKALREAIQTKDSQFPERIGNLPKKTNSIDGNEENIFPMVETFLQVVSETRLSVRQFSKTLFRHIDETDNFLMENLNSLLQPYKLSLNSKHSKVVLYHLEAIINHTLFQDFENCVFRKNGYRKLLDPLQDCQAQFSLFVSLRNLSWNQVLRKGTKHYSEDLSKFCDEKMSFIISTLNWTRPWPEQLLQAFFAAAKCIWLLHLLAFSFNPQVGILRVGENRSFDSHFMEDIFMGRQRSNGPGRVKVMIMPGFYVQDRVFRCKVICRYKSLS